VNLIQDRNLTSRVADEENDRAQRVWSIYGAQQGQPVAINGKSRGREMGENKPNRLR
jgi:hypothetical protein